MKEYTKDLTDAEFLELARNSICIIFVRKEIITDEIQVITINKL